MRARLHPAGPDPPGIWLSKQPSHIQQDFLNSISKEELAEFENDWTNWARAEQLPPNDSSWRVFLALGGRGGGKTKSGAEWTHQQTNHTPNLVLAAPTAADARDIVVEGPSGILATSKPSNPASYEPSKRRVTWQNGAIATVVSADEPDRFRGFNVGAAWCDELASWEALRKDIPFDRSPWHNLRLGVRLPPAQIVVTTTPRPLPAIRELLDDPNCIVSRFSTYANRANLDPSFFEAVVSTYEGTRLGRQELYGDILDDVEGSLWSRDMIEAAYLSPAEAPPFSTYQRIVVGVDPPTSEKGTIGIVAVGLLPSGHLHVLTDASMSGTPRARARAVVDTYRTFHASRVIAEKNQGGDMVEYLLRSVSTNLPLKLVRASQSKEARAEPVASLYERGLVKHVGSLPKLEDELVTWAPGSGPSPDRLDALAWSITELALRQSGTMKGYSPVGRARVPHLRVVG